MNKNPFKSIVLYLGSNFWAQKDCTFPVDPEEFIYRDKLYCDKNIWDAVVKKLPEFKIDTLVIAVGEGVVYPSHPEIAIEGSWSAQELKNEIAKIRKMGIRVVPYNNFAPLHNAWMGEYAYMAGTPAYYEFCKDIVRDVIDIFDTPEMFHLGLGDEGYNAKYDAADSHNFTVIFYRHILRDYANMLFDVCREKGVRPWMWADIKTVVAFGGDEAFKAAVGRDVLLSSTYYANPIIIYVKDGKLVPSSSIPPEAAHYEKLSSWGYTQIPAVTRRIHPRAPKRVMEYVSLKCDNIDGFLMQPFTYTVERKYYALMNSVQNLSDSYDKVFGEGGTING